MKKVVVAEASPTIKSVADSLLRQNGYDVVCTSDGLQAWEIVSGEGPDLVLIGQGLSGISGLDLCRKISNDSLTGGIPVIVMIGAKDAVTEEQVIASGARGKLRKPFSPKDLLDAVARLTGQVSARTSKISEPIDIQKAKITTQVSSSQPLHDNKESYNLEWLDLKDAEPNGIIPKVASFDIASEDAGLVISDDQYGLSSPEFEPEPEYAPPVNPKKDEDYEWFLGEIKKEMEGKSKANHQAEPEVSVSTVPPKLTPKKPAEALKFDDIASAKEPHRPATAYPRPRENGSPVISPLSKPDINHRPSIQKDTQSTSGGQLTEEQLNMLADRVAARLAAQIVSKIDKNLIMDAIKAVIKQ
jgi:CheY-like chemotaxis protein